MTFAATEVDKEERRESGDYRALSRSAMLGLACGILSVLTLPFAISRSLSVGCALSPMAIMSMLGAVCCGLAYMRIKANPMELTGIKVSLTGLLLCVLSPLIGIPAQVHIYMTECPEGFQRISFAKLQSESKLAPVSDKALELNGEKVFIKGYVYPGEQKSNLQNFVLVRDLGTCCFGGQPKPTHMMDVQLSGKNRIDYSRGLRRIAGVLKVNPSAVRQGSKDAVFELVDAYEVE